MNKLRKLIAASVVLLFGSLTINISAFAQVQNVLGSVVVTGEDFSIASSDGTTFTKEFPLLEENANLTDCEATSDGTFCINNGSHIVELSSFGTPLFTCESAGFAAKRNRPAQCSAIAVEDESTLYIAGILNKNGSAIVTCVKDPSNGGLYDCAPLVQGRPPIRDLDRVPSGLIYVENKNAVVLLTQIEGAPIIDTLAIGRDFGLAKGKVKEELLNVARIVAHDGKEAYAVTTSFGRLIAFKSALGGVVTDIIETCLAGTCDASGDVSFDVAQNAEMGGPIYALVSDTDTASGAGIVFVYSNNLSGEELVLDLDVDPNEIDTIIVSTSGSITITNNFNGILLSVFEGQNINLGNCDPDCPVGNFAKLSFNPVGTATTATAWEITDIPHCSWWKENDNIKDTCVAAAITSTQPTMPPSCGTTDVQLVQLCLCDGNVLRLVGDTVDGFSCATAPPGLLEFNVTKVLPPNLIAEFDPTSLPDGKFPDLWMPPDFQAQPVNGHFFQALLIDAGDAQSSETPELVVDDFDPPAYNCPADGPDNPIQSNMVLRMRERAATCDVDSGNCDEHIGSAITYACESTRSRGCCSLYPLDTMLALLPPAKDADDLWYLDSQVIPLDPNVPEGPKVDDSAAAKFVDNHFEQLEVFQYPACNDADEKDVVPLDPGTCIELEAKRLNAKRKLANALLNTATGTGNCSQQSTNYQAFLSQISNYIDLAKPFEGNAASDPNGRVQALIAHASVLEYAVNDILKPTIPGSHNCEDGWDEDHVDESGVPFWITN